MKTIKIRNTSGASIVCAGQTIFNNEEHTLTDIEIDLFAADSGIFQAIDDGDIVIVYNGVDLNASDGKDAILGIYPRSVKVSGNDTTAEYLSEKLVSGTGITLTEQNDGGAEDLEISITPGILDGYLSEEAHRPLDELVHLISEDSFEEVTYLAGNKVGSMIIYTDSGKSTKIREEQYTYDSWNRVTQILSIQYNSSGAEVERMTEDFTHDGNRVTSITRNVTLS